MRADRQKRTEEISTDFGTCSFIGCKTSRQKINSDHAQMLRTKEKSYQAFKTNRFPVIALFA